LAETGEGDCSRLGSDPSIGRGRRPYLARRRAVIDGRLAGVRARGWAAAAWTGRPPGPRRTRRVGFARAL